MITVVEGRPGMGKSVWLVSEILRYLRNGHNVYTNVAISDVRLKRRFGDRLHFIESLEDCIHLRHGKIVLDEIQTYLNSLCPLIQRVVPNAFEPKPYPALNYQLKSSTFVFQELLYLLHIDIILLDHHN